jgi:hypothetical protein
MQVPSRGARRRLLGEAFEQGVRYFDVARMYGLGAAEGELGSFARGRREELTIATKFGIDPGAGVGRLARFQAPARAALARMPRLRAAVKRRQSSFHQARRYDGAGARVSLEKSLRELGTDYVDVFFVHGPEAGDEVDLEGIGATMGELRQAGLIRAWGFAGDPGPCIRLGEATADKQIVLQIRDEIFSSFLSKVPPGTPVVSFGVIGEAARRACDLLDASAEEVAALLLQDAIERNAGGRVLFSTTRPERIRAAVDAAAALPGQAAQERLARFRERVGAGLGEGRG